VAVDNSFRWREAIETSEDYAVIEKMAKLARLYASGTSLEEELKTLKQRLAAAIKKVEQTGVCTATFAPLVPIGSAARYNGLDWNPDIGRRSFEAHDAESAFSSRLRVTEKSICLASSSANFKQDQLASNWFSTGRRAIRIVSYVCVAVLLGVGCRLCWSQHDEAKNVVRVWAQTLGLLSNVTTSSQFPSPPTAAGIPSAAVRRPVPIAPDQRTAHLATQDAAAKNELLPNNARTTVPATKQDARQKAASPPFHDAKVTSNAESKPNTMEGWTVHGVANGAAVLEGPDGFWRVKRGDLIPGAGKIESIARWGNRWIVVTSSGLISTP